jgi:hypothetical protein
LLGKTQKKKVLSDSLVRKISGLQGGEDNEANMGFVEVDAESD